LKAPYLSLQIRNINWGLSGCLKHSTRRLVKFGGRVSQTIGASSASSEEAIRYGASRWLGVICRRIMNSLWWSRFKVFVFFDYRENHELQPLTSNLALTPFGWEPATLELHGLFKKTVHLSQSGLRSRIHTLFVCVILCITRGMIAAYSHCLSLWGGSTCRFGLPLDPVASCSTSWMSQQVRRVLCCILL